jgi:glycosyltransferase involved in cell wall biosynthesis
LYSNALAAVYVPINEDWGLIPLEAAASGKPTIGVNEGGLRETIKDGVTGFLLDSVNPKEIAKKIDLLASNKKLARKMGKSALKNVKDKLDISKILLEFENRLIEINNKF